VLTDNVYHYDGVANALETADRFEERTRSQPVIDKASVLQSLKDHQQEQAGKSSPGLKPARQDTVL